MTRFAATVLLLITVIPARSVGADLPGTDASDFACLGEKAVNSLLSAQGYDPVIRLGQSHGVTYFKARLNGAWRKIGLDSCTSAPVSDETYR